MKVRKFSALVLSLMLAAMLAVPALAASGDLIIDLTAADIEFFAGGGDGNDYFIQSGSPVKSKDGNGLKLSGRNNDWDAFDIKTGEFCEAGKEYTIVVQVKATDGATKFKLSMGGSPYSPYTDTVDGPNGEVITLKYKAYDGADIKNNVRIQTDVVTDSFTILSAKVYEGDPPAAAPAGGGGGGSNPDTGDTSFVVFAGMALLAAAGLGFAFYRKSKVQ